jgi:hypothetical protein
MLEPRDVRLKTGCAAAAVAGDLPGHLLQDLHGVVAGEKIEKDLFGGGLRLG